MKINRHSTTEENKTTALWLHEFAYDLEKNAQNVDYLKDYLNKIQKGKKFNNIEEKLADIRSRVGLDLATKVANEMDNIEHEHKISLNSNCCSSASKKCSCSVKTASVHDEKDVGTMGNILKYIEDMIRHEPHLDSAVVISRCKDEEGLRFNDLEKKIDKAKLINYIKDLIDSNNKPTNESVSYTPSESLSEFDADDRIAEYYNHAEPNRS